MKKINKMIYSINNKKKYKDQKEWYQNYNQKIKSKRIFINCMIIQKFNSRICKKNIQIYPKNIKKANMI